MGRTAVLAYSGGLDTSCAIAWLKEDYGFDEVVAVLVDVGQEVDFAPAVERGSLAGADDVLVARPQGALRGRPGRQGAARERALRGALPARLRAFAAGDRAGRRRGRARLGAEAAVHGCTGKGNDQLRFELAFKATYPGVHVIAPLRDHVWTRDEEIEFAQARGIPVEAKQSSPYSIDDNLVGRSIECGILEDPWAAPPEDAFALTGLAGGRARAGRRRRRLRGGPAGRARRRRAAARTSSSRS